MNTLRLTAALLALTPLARSETFVVDDSGGPGVDFTDLPPAMAAAVPGDVFLVRAGSYSPFVADQGVTLIAQHTDVYVSGTVTVQNVPAGERFSMEGLSFTHLSVTSCDGLVSVTGRGSAAPNIYWVRVDSSSDVRLRGLDVNANGGNVALQVDDSWVEAVDSYFEGATGADGEFDAEDGQDAVVATSGSRVHLARCSAQGGHGGWVWSEWTSGPGGDGADAVQVDETSEAILTGSGVETYRGGYGGSHDIWVDYYGADGYAIRNGGGTRYSGVVLNSPITGSGTYVHPAVDDPHLTAHSTPAGLRIAIWGAVGGNARLYLGREARQPSAPFLTKPLMVEPVVGLPLGIIGGGGNVTYTLDYGLPTSSLASFLLVLQGSVVTGGETVLTNTLVRRRP